MLRTRYLWALNQACGLSPAQVDEMGWFDLIQFTVLIDQDNRKIKEQLRRQTQAAQPTQSQWQRLW